MDTRLISALCTVCLAFMSGILQIYACCKFISLRSMLVIQKRYPKLITIEAIAVIIYLILVVPFYMNSTGHYTNFGNKNLEKYLWGPRSIAFLCFCPMQHLIWWLELSRLWLISYNLHYLNALKNEKWKSQIDANIANNDWYIRNKNKYGNARRVVPVAMIWWLVIVTLIDIGYYFDFRLGTVINSIFYLQGVAIAVFIYYRCRNYYILQDNLLFYYEFKATMTIWLVLLPLFFIGATIRFVSLETTMQIISSNIIGFTAIFSLFAPSLLSTLWIPLKFIASRKQQSQTLVTIKKSIEMSITDDELDAVNPDAFYNTELLDTLKNQQQFERFIQFMFRDFSSEAMLGYIEMVQFKECFVKEMDYKKEIDCIYVNSLYENVPKSSIVYDGKDDMKGIERMKRVADKLCDKYIRIGSEYEVNIAWSLRKKLIALAENNWNMEMKDFISVFDRVLYDLFAFMKQSFERFMY